METSTTPTSASPLQGHQQRTMLTPVSMDEGDDSEMAVTPSRYPKRKRAEVKYYSEAVEEDSESELEDLVPFNPPKRAKKAAKPLPKEKQFPFLKLPAELRNKIYRECLTAEEGIFLRGRQISHKRKTARCLPNECTPSWQYGYTNSQVPDAIKAVTEIKPLTPQLLAVCKQIHEEAASILYAQKVHLCDTYALHTFMTQLSPRAAGMLRDLTIYSWCGTRSHKAINFPAFSALGMAGAVNLERLHLNCSLGFFSPYTQRSRFKGNPVPHLVARRIFRDCYPWIEAVGKAKGDRYAAVELLEIRDSNYDRALRSKQGDDEKEAALAELKAQSKVELRELIRKNW